MSRPIGAKPGLSKRALLMRQWSCLREAVEKLAVAVTIMGCPFSLQSAYAAGCVDRISPSAVQYFVDDPKYILESSRSRDPAVFIEKVTDLSLHGGAAVKALVSLIRGARSEQRALMGQGMAKAVALCEDSAPGIARDISREAEQVYDPAFRLAYRRFLYEGRDAPSRVTAPLLPDAASRPKTIEMHINQKPPPLTLGRPFDPLETGRVR